MMIGHGEAADLSGGIKIEEAVTIVKNTSNGVCFIVQFFPS